MSKIKVKYDDDFKKNAVRLSYAGPKSIPDIVADLSVDPGRLYAWRKKYTADGDKTRYTTLEEENKALRLQVTELSMERDMLKKQQLASRI